MKSKNFLLVTLLLACAFLKAQNVMQSPEYIKALTVEWTGERFADGRPKVSDNLLERLKAITLEEAWAELIEKGYFNQFEGNWKLLHEDKNNAMTGRAVTAQFMPARTDLENQVLDQGKTEGRMYQQRRTVSWAMTTLVEGDFYVADGYDKQAYGTVMGSNLGSGVWARSHRGAIVYGHIRDTEDLRKVEGFNVWVKGTDPSYMRKTLLTTINAPIRIGEATVLPGDAVLAKKDGVIFVPSHLVEHIVLTGEVTELFDIFGQQRIKEGKYTAGIIDSKWSDEIKKDFRSWLDTYKGKLPMTRPELDKFLEKRNF